MKRLTFEGNFCDIAVCQENPCPYNGSCTQREVWERLKAYEDTGLEPSEVETMRESKADAQFMLTELCRLCDYDRLEELAQADKKGLLVVLPCRIGDDMWGLSRYNGHTRRARQGAVTEMYFGDDMSLGIGVKGAGRGIFGKTVFLTREEAEAAIAASKNIESKPVNDLYDEDGGLIGE